MLHYCRGPVLSLVLDVVGSTCYSGGLDSTIRSWSIPTVDIDAYDAYGEFSCEMSQEISGENGKLFSL